MINYPVRVRRNDIVVNRCFDTTWSVVDSCDVEYAETMFEEDANTIANALNLISNPVRIASCDFCPFSSYSHCCVEDWYHDMKHPTGDLDFSKCPIRGRVVAITVAPTDIEKEWAFAMNKLDLKLRK